MQARELIGECPICGDELYVFRTYSHRRIIKCVNDECSKHIAYPVPHAGSITATGLKCQKANFPLLVVTPHLKLKNRYKEDVRRIYFWAAEPCFKCSKQSKCDVLNEAKLEYCVTP